MASERDRYHSTATIADATAVLSSFGGEENASRRVKSRRSTSMLSTRGQRDVASYRSGSNDCISASANVQTCLHISINS